MEGFDRLVEIMAQLRAPGGCPWDREQSHGSIAQYAIEEAYEVVEAIEKNDPKELCTELGDLLLQVVFHAQMAAEAGTFTISDVCRAVSEKLIRRHPHVFAETEVRGVADVLANWEAIKAKERGPAASAIDGVPAALPALQRAARIGEKAARVGFDWASAEAVLAKVDEERAELTAAIASGSPTAIEHEVGDLLHATANLARKLELDPEAALRRANLRFANRFQHLEKALASEGRLASSCSEEELENHWQAAKAALALEEKPDLTGTSAKAS
jgi:MazG family protein